MMFLLGLLAFTLPAQAAGSEEITRKLQDQFGFRCTSTPDNKGAFCVESGKKSYMLVPNGLRRVSKLVFYAHGMLNVCGPGLSGEDFLKGHMAKLASLGAVAVIPVKPNAHDMSFPFERYVSKVEEMTDARGVPWLATGHSAGGEFLAGMLSQYPAVTRRMEKVLLLDANYCFVHNARPCNQRPRPVLENWLKTLSFNPQLKIVSYASSTFPRGEQFKEAINRKVPGALTNIQKTDGHCPLTRYFSEL